MTIITKAIGEKKPTDKMEQPLVVDCVPEVEAKTPGDPEAQWPPRGNNDPHLGIKDQFFILQRASLYPSSRKLYCLLVSAIFGMGIGVIGGMYVYRHYARDQMHRFSTGWYSIPYEGSNRSPLDTQAYSDHYKAESDSLDLWKPLDNNYFKERFEIDLDKHYEEIDVPDFRGGRQGRFIHDFVLNLTGIIDIDGHCCFVMPLNRKRVLPPRNMVDLLMRMHNGYYEVDTEEVRETMKAVLPPIFDLSTVGTFIARECKHMPTYRLEKVKYNGENHAGIVKRDAPADTVYGHFAGMGIDKFEIINLNDIVQKK